jgi:hypothetical protein
MTSYRLPDRWIFDTYPFMKIEKRKDTAKRKALVSLCVAGFLIITKGQEIDGPEHKTPWCTPNGRYHRHLSHVLMVSLWLVRDCSTSSVNNLAVIITVVTKEESLVPRNIPRRVAFRQIRMCFNSLHCFGQEFWTTTSAVFEEVPTF